MKFVNKKLICVLTLGVLAGIVVSGCGGGDGSPGRTSEQYQITLRADSKTLPDSNNEYGTILYVDATEGGRPIAGGDSVFECRIADGLDVGSLYYLDDEDDHVDDDGNPKPYRSITLGANAGGDSFYFVADRGSGDATVTCTVTDPRDSRVYAASVELTVL